MVQDFDLSHQQYDSMIRFSMNLKHFGLVRHFLKLPQSPR